MKKQKLANLAIAAIFIITANLVAQPRNKHKEPWELAPGKSAPAPVKPGTVRTPENGPKPRPTLQPANPKPANPAPASVAKPAPAFKPEPAKPGPVVRPEPAKPTDTQHRGVVIKSGPVINPTPMGKTDPVTYRGEPKHGGKPVTVVAPGPKPAPGPAVHPAPGPGPKPGPAPHPAPVVGPTRGPVVHSAPAPKPHHDPHIDHHGGHNHGGFFHRLFEPAPPRPRGYRTFPHRHPTSKFTFIWFDYLPSGKVYELTDYVIYECRYCHLVHYSPVVPANEFCPAVPGTTHSYQILGHYGDYAFRCATCGVTINSNAVPNVGYCGAQYHVWQQLLEY